MKKFKILLLYPNLMMKHILSPAIGIFTALLKENNFEVELFDTTYYKTETENPDEKRKQFMQVRSYNLGDYGIKVKDTDVIEDFKKRVSEFNPDIIGVTSVQDTFPLALKLIASLGNNRPKTIFGGIYISYLQEQAFKYKEIDMICIGEGEKALLELCQKMCDGQDYTDILNIYIKYDGGIIKNRVKPLIDLNELPTPDYSLYEEKRFYSPMQGKMYRMVPVDFDRGCPYNCHFCASPAYRAWYREQNSEIYFRQKSHKKIIEEMKALVKKHSPQYLYFNSDTFLYRREDVLAKLLAAIKEEINLPFWCQSRVEMITKNKMKLLKDCGCDRITIGLEHGNEEFRKKIVGKAFTNKQFIDAVEIINEVGIPLSVNNMIGFPYETRDLIFDTIELNRRVKSDSISVFILYPYMGTKIYKFCIENDLIDQSVYNATLMQNSVIKNNSLSREHLNNLLKTFCLYVRFPKEYWKEIEKVERNEAGSDEIFKKLSQEYSTKYF